MRYLSNSSEQQALMLKALGLHSVEDLLTTIPKSIRLRSPLDLPPPLSEPELLDRFGELEGRNAARILSFLGAGVNQHFIPLVIDSLCSRGEFLTSYTPYQAEISQGTLQAVFEFQTFICQLTGMEISNASMYDGSSALAEAVLMARRISGRRRILLARTVHPEYRAVVDTITHHQDLTIQTVGHGGNGCLDLGELETRLGEDVGALVVQSPNFLGNLEPLGVLADRCRRQGVLLVVNIAELLSLGIVQPPGSAGADIVSGEAQSLGIPPGYGGPHVGFLSTRQQYVRNLPGRLVGQTVDRRGQRGYVLTLATREQHIRREKATSNICTNQNLTALMVTMFCSLLGQKGIRELAIQNVAKAQYGLAALRRLPVEILFEGPRFNEFVFRLNRPYEEVAERFHAAGVVPGLPLGRYDLRLENALLVSITETKSRQDIDRLVELVKAVA